MEDFYEDIVYKAQAGLKLGDEELCKKAQITEDDLKAAKSGKFDENVAKKLALALHLDPKSLIEAGKKAWTPKHVDIVGLKRIKSTYGTMAVNAYLIWDPKTNEAALFDTGADANLIVKEIESLGLVLRFLLLTHSHPDHIAELPKILMHFPEIETWIHKKEKIPKAELFEEGKQFQLGKLNIKTFKTSGHSVGGTTYFIEGLERPVTIVGDALFAGSMGGAPSAYREALKNNREHILSLPKNTIICPGHGPMTTVGEEKKHNPFFPDHKT